MQASSKPVSFSKGKSVSVVGLMANISSRHRWKMKVVLPLSYLICLAPCWKYGVVSEHLKRSLVRTGQGHQCFYLDLGHGSSPSGWTGFK